MIAVIGDRALWVSTSTSDMSPLPYPPPQYGVEIQKVKWLVNFLLIT